MCCFCLKEDFRAFTINLHPGFLHIQNSFTFSARKVWTRATTVWLSVVLKGSYDVVYNPDKDGTYVCDARVSQLWSPNVTATGEQRPDWWRVHHGSSLHQQDEVRGEDHGQTQQAAGEHHGRQQPEDEPDGDRADSRPAPHLPGKHGQCGGSPGLLQQQQGVCVSITHLCLCAIV